MTRLFYDGSFEGLLSVVFDIYERKLALVKLQKGDLYGCVMFEEVIKINTSDLNANRVLKGLQKKLSTDAIQRLYVAHMAEMENEDDNLIGYIRHVFDSPHNIEEDYGNRYVARLSQLVQKVRREKHRMEAFVRFQKLKDETYYATIEPDFNVLPLLTRHFRKRYADQKWIIYDIKRNYGAYYDLHDTQYIELDFSVTSQSRGIITAYGQNESIYQQLWKNYFNSANIPARKNMKLHLRHIPRRYWRNLTEKI